MLATYISHIWVCSILITLSGDTEKNPEPSPSSYDKFSICHWNLNSISAHISIKICLLHVYVSTLSEAYLDSSISSNNNNLTIPSYDIYRADHPSTRKSSSVESNRHSIPTRVHQLRNENRGKIV